MNATCKLIKCLHILRLCRFLIPGLQIENSLIVGYVETLLVFYSWAQGRECVLGINPLIVGCAYGATVIGPLRSGGPISDY